MHARSPAPGVPHRRRITAGRVVLIMLLLILLSGFWLVARSGLVPGLASLVGADRPRDLGVRSSPAQATEVVQALGIRLESPPAPTIPADYQKIYTGQVRIDREFTESEVSALLTYNHVSYWAIKNAQVKIHQDGRLEASMIVRTTDLEIRRDGPESEGLMRYLPTMLPAELPVYLQGRLEATGPQQIRAEIASLQIGRVTVPTSIASGQAQAAATSYINDRLHAIPGLSIQELSFHDGRVHFKGTWPKEFRRIPLP